MISEKIESQDDLRILLEQCVIPAVAKYGG